MDETSTVFYLRPLKDNAYALAIVENPLNRDRMCKDPDGTEVPCLRIGLDQIPKNPPVLASFGRRSDDDVILGKDFCRNTQCYFDFNKETGELLLHDVSQKNNTELFEAEYRFKDGLFQECRGVSQMSSRLPRQCAVVLTRDPYTNHDRRWIFKMRNARFLLIPPPQSSQDGHDSVKKKLEFIDQCASIATQGVTELTAGLSQLSYQLAETQTATSSTITNSYNLRYRGPHQPKDHMLIEYTRLGLLGVGGQGEVHKIVNIHDGNHLACKTIAVKANVPKLNINSEADFKKFVEREVDLVHKLRDHASIVPYLFIQGFKFGQDIEIFMPVYEGSLQNLLETFRPQKPEMHKVQSMTRNSMDAIPERMQSMTTDMLRQILDALKFVHTYEPQIVHGDVKPGNILYRGHQFFLTDFGLAQLADGPNERVGTKWFMAPELYRDGDNTSRTPKVDIYALGVTIAECLFRLPFAEKRNRTTQSE